jgi:hypothetical protein
VRDGLAIDDDLGGELGFEGGAFQVHGRSLQGIEQEGSRLVVDFLHDQPLDDLGQRHLYGVCIL